MVPRTITAYLTCYHLLKYHLSPFFYFLLRLIVQDEKIGDVFVSCFSKSLVLEIYSDFINNFNQAMELAKSESKRKSAFADFLKVEDGNGFLGKNYLRILYQIEGNWATI